MTGKANAVFWIGLVLIFANFWISGQSTTFWKAISLKGATASTPVTAPPAAPFGRDNKGNPLPFPIH